MKKRILPVLVLLALMVSLLCPAVATAAQNTQASLTLHYQKDGKTFADLPVAIYRVAKRHANGAYTLVEPFVSCPISIYGITTQEQWQTMAQTVESFIAQEETERYCSNKL